jgi:protein-glutamine gamma-glutamyltransferase
VSREPLRPLVWAAAALAGGVLLHIDRPPYWAIAAAAVCIAWRLLAAGGAVPLPRPPARLLLAAILIAAVYTQFRTFNGLHAGTGLLIAMGSIKLFETRSRRDRGIVVGVALFLLLAACLDRQSLLRTPLYLLQTWLCCTAFAVNTREGPSLSSRAAIALAARTLLLAIPLALVLFVFFPRIAGSFWALPEKSLAETGLGDTMSPGSISVLTESDDAAFRVRFADSPPPPQERYWRGPVLHDFDGYTWSRTPGRFYRQQPLEYLGRPYAYQVTLEPHSKHWWFALDIANGSPDRTVFFTYDYQLLAAEPVTQPISYDAVSHTHTRTIGPLSVLARRYDTALPADRNPKTRQLARTLRSRAGTDTEFTRSVLQMFRQQGFEYSLTPPLLGFDSVDDFLFNTRKGFCGHYASAFVTLMRAAGVPARVVTGYLGGEWNPIGRFYTVRQSDAHAWAEIWIDGRGWVRIDPTAVAAPERLQRGIYDFLPNAGSVPKRLMRNVLWLARLRQNWDALNAWWDESVVSFDFGKQLNLLRLLGFTKPDWQHLGWALAGGLTLWLVWVAWHFGRRARPAGPDRLARAYARLCRKLARVALSREPYQGPLAYANALSAYRPDVADAARPLLERYAELRYGADGSNDVEFERAVARLRVPKPAAPFPHEWRTMLERTVPLYRRMPPELRLRIEPIARRFLKRVDFVGCNGLVIVDEMRVTIAVQACLLLVKRNGSFFDELRTVLLYPDEFLVTESEEDAAGVVTEGTRALSGQTFETARIVLSWRDVQESGADEEAYNVVLHEFAHYLDHSFGGALAEHEIFEREFRALAAAVERGEPGLIDPYGAEHPAEFFAVATETFFEKPLDMQRHHPQLFAELRRFYGLDPSRWS